jgi:hypothetical protein
VKLHNGPVPITLRNRMESHGSWSPMRIGREPEDMTPEQQAREWADRIAWAEWNTKRGYVGRRIILRRLGL